MASVAYDYKHLDGQDYLECRVLLPTGGLSHQLSEFVESSQDRRKEAKQL